MPVETIASAAVKAGVAFGVVKVATRNQDSWMARKATQAAIAVIEATLNNADRRTWNTLPKQFQYCRLTTPADRLLHLSRQAGEDVQVDLLPGRVNVVYVKAVTRESPLIVSQFILKGALPATASNP